MVVYVVQYHSNAWGDQMAMDDILGVYTSEEAAKDRANKFKAEFAWHDDDVTVGEYDLNSEYPSLKELYRIDELEDAE